MKAVAAKTVRRTLAIAGMSAVVALVAAGPAAAQDPEGNNGTVKIHAGAGEPRDERKSEPQVCTFHIHAFNFDPNQELRYTITSIDAGGVVEAGSFQVGPNGSGREPASGAMSVENAGSYRLDVATDDGGKSKTFQVTCEGGVLAATGGEPSPFLTAAGLLMTLGAALILRSRRGVWSRARS
jgi:LPXTG-motif cell wall-anchored protein